MNVEELKEQTEHAEHSGEKAIGLTTTIVAVLLAIATMLGHRAHTEEVRLQTRVNDLWSFYQAKHERAYGFGRHAEDMAALHQDERAANDLRISTEEECGLPAEGKCASPLIRQSPILQQFVAQKNEAAAGPKAVSAKEKTAGPRKDGAVDVQEHAREAENETEMASRKADFFDGGELFLEISIVLCSVALLTQARVYWRLSFIATALGVAAVVWGLLLR